MDAHANLAISQVAAAPSPAASGTSLDVTAGQGTRFPAVPFNATVWPAGALPDPANAEIVRVTNIATDTLTITRTQEGTSARTIVVGDYIAATITAKTLTDVEDGISILSQAVSVAQAALSVRIDTQSQGVSVLSQKVSLLSQSLSALSNAVSAADAALSVRVDTQSQGVSVLSQKVSVLSQSISALSQAVSAADAALSVRIDTQSNLISQANSTISILVSNVSLLSNKVSITSNLVSALTSAHNALSNVVSGIANGGSVTSTEVSAVSAQAASALSDAVSVGTATANALSNALSLLVCVPTAETARARWTRRTLTASAQTVSSSTIANIGSLSVSVTSGGLYRLEAMVAINRVAGTVMAFGLTFPAMTTLRGQIWTPQSAVNSPLQTASIMMQGQAFGEAASGSLLVSVISMANVSTHFQILAILQPSATGVIQLQMKAAGGASAAQAQIGSYIEVERLG